MVDRRGIAERAATGVPGELLQLTALHETVADAQEIDLGLFDDAALDALLAELVMARDRLSVVVSTALAEWEARGAWARDGSQSPAARLARLTSRSARTCQTDLVRARRLGLLSTGVEAVVDGTMSFDVLDLLVHVATPQRQAFLAEHEAALVGAVRGLPYHAARTAVRYWAELADDRRSAEADLVAAADGGSGEVRTPPVIDPPADHGGGGRGVAAESAAGQEVGSTAGSVVGARSKVFLSTTLDDTVILDGTFDAISGTVVGNELSRLAAQIAESDRVAGVHRSAAERRAAALVEMATRSAMAPEGGRRPRPLFTVVVGAAAFDRLCELSNGRVLSPAALLPHLDQAMVESVLFDGPSTVISVSSRRRFTGALRRAIEVRDRHCRHTGVDCEVPAEDCDVDHIAPYSQGGATSQFNGRIECWPHNQKPDLHDHGVEPLPTRTVDRLDELRCRLRWRIQRSDIDDGGSDDGGSEDGGFEDGGFEDDDPGRRAR